MASVNLAKGEVAVSSGLQNRRQWFSRQNWSCRFDPVQSDTWWQMQPLLCAYIFLMSFSWSLMNFFSSSVFSGRLGFELGTLLLQLGMLVCIY